MDVKLQAETYGGKVYLYVYPPDAVSSMGRLLVGIYEKKGAVINVNKDDGSGTIQFHIADDL
jgi:hypothetical protein